MKKHSSFLVVVFFTIAVYTQTNWHIADTGSDSSGNGTLSSPYKTLQKVVNSINAGDTIFVHQGIYRNDDFDITKTAPNVLYADDNHIWAGNNLLTINNKNGNATNYIVFMPYQNEEVTLTFDNNYGVLIKNSSYIKFIGFIIKGVGDKINQDEANAAWGKYKINGVKHDLATELNIDLNNPPAEGSTINKTKQTNAKKPSYYNGRGLVVNNSHHIEILNNTVEYATNSAIRVQKSDWTTIKNNTVRYNTYYTTAGVGAITVAESISIDTDSSVKIKLINNYVHHNENRMVSWNPNKDFIKWTIDEGTGLFLTRNNASNGSGTTGGGTDYTHGQILIANNIAAFNGASGVVSHFTNNVIIEHNTCYKNGTTNGGKPGGIGINTSNNVTIRNNISYTTPDSWAIGKLAGTLNNLSLTNNLVYNENGITIHNNMPNGWVEQNPLLVAPENEDFSLQNNSPAIDAGTNTTLVNDDFNGDLRNDATPDIGAFEYNATASVNDLFEKKVVVFPNPVTDFLHLKGLMPNSKKVTIFTVLGKVVLQKEVSNLQIISLNLKKLPKGIYFVKTATFSIPFIKK